VDRRKRFVEAAEKLLAENRPLLDLIKECLQNHPVQRPQAKELVTRLRDNILLSADTHSPSQGEMPLMTYPETDDSSTGKGSGVDTHTPTSARVQSPTDSREKVDGDSNSMDAKRTSSRGDAEFPVIRGADIIAQTKIEIPPDKPLNFHWERYGFKVHIPAGAINAEPVTLCIKASLSGDYQLPDDGNLVSGVYWLSLHPPVKRFHKKVTISIQHCASVGDSALSFITAKCTEEPPYTFKSLPAKIFSESKEGTIEVDHFSSLAIKGRKHSISDYAFCTFYIQKQLNIYEAHITVTPNSRLQLKGVTKKYEGKEEGPRRNACVTETEVSLNIHKNTWEKDGWEVTLLLPPTLKKKDLDGYKRGKIIPHFSMRLKLQHSLNAQSLVQEIGFAGVEPQTFFIAILRDPLPEQASETKGKTHSQPANLCINDLAAVKTELLSVTARWRQIGEVLELAPPKLEVIAAENSDLEICLSKVLSQWLNKAYNTERLGEPSWKLLARVVANPAGGDNPALAQQITGRYGGAEHS
jgi:hypothetical protein